MAQVKVKELLIARIRRDSGAQFRPEISPIHVERLHEALECGEKLPPIIVFFDGSQYWMADGDHRIEAHLLMKHDTIGAEVHEGSQDDAIFYGTGANASHGLPRNGKTKRAQVTMLLEKWPQMGVSGIAKKARVSRPFVYQVLNANPGLKAHLSTLTSDTRQYTDKHGNLSTMSVGNIGQQLNQPQGTDRQAQKQAHVDQATEEVKVMPLFQALSLYGHRGYRFKEQVLVYRDGEDVIDAAKALKPKVDACIASSHGVSGPITDICLKLISVSDPVEWEGCPHCLGSGRVGERSDPCGHCQGGFVVFAGTGVSAEVVQQHAERLHKAAG